MHVRLATSHDVEAVLPMVEAICAFHHHLDPARYDFLPDVVERYRHWLPQRAADSRSVFLVAAPTPNALPIGFVVGQAEANIPIYRTSEFAFIHDLWVEPAHRRRGGAAALLAECLRRFAAMNLTQVRLETAFANDAARRLFARAGFRVDAQTMFHSLTRPPQ